VGRERPPRSGAEAGGGRTREKVVRCEGAGEEEMEARHREGRGGVRARRLEGSRTFGPRLRGEAGGGPSGEEDKGLTERH